MIEVLNDNNNIFEATNNILNFKFNKKGNSKGTFEIYYISNGTIECQLKNCYSALNFFNLNSASILESKSTEYQFENQIEQISNNFGKGIRIVFQPINSHNYELSFAIQFNIFENCDFLLIKLINIQDKNKLSVHSIAPLKIADSYLWLSGINRQTNLFNISWFKQGFQSWSPCELLFGYEKDIKGLPIEILNICYDNQDYNIEGRFYSEYCTVITDLSTKNSLILGFITLKDQFCRIVMDFEDSNTLKTLTAFGCMDGITFDKSSINSSEELYVSFKTQNRGYSGLIDYAKVVKANVNETPVSKIPIGWCSWYYYYTNITEKDLIKNLEFFKKNREILPIDFFQLDDGYFTEVGDYDRINAKFPNGLERLFSQINKEGFKSGIWTAPFFAVKKSELFKNHRNWFLKKNQKLLKTMYNWNTFEYGLDLTQIEVINYLKSFFEKLLYAYKDVEAPLKEQIINFFKIDFLYAGAPYNADYENKKFTRAQLYYNGIKAIREAITDRSFLLGCGAPLGPCVGIVDGMRISYDTGPIWEAKYLLKIEGRTGVILPCLKVALLNILYRSFMHKHFWINDPDCLMIRRTDTKLNIDEIKLQITVFGLSGGQILISDDMTKLSEEEINDAKILIPPYNPTEFNPILTDAFTSKFPSIYVLGTNEPIGKRFLVSIINWENKLISKSFSISELIPNISNNFDNFFIYDFWNKEFLGEYRIDDLIKLENFNPHSCYYLSIIPINAQLNDTPILLSTDLHISQGCYEIRKFEYRSSERVILIDIELTGKREGNLYLKLPKNVSVSKYNFEFLRFDDLNNVWSLRVEFKDKISLSIGLNYDS